MLSTYTVLIVTPHVTSIYILWTGNWADYVSEWLHFKLWNLSLYICTLIENYFCIKWFNWNASDICGFGTRKYTTSRQMTPMLTVFYVKFDKSDFTNFENLHWTRNLGMRNCAANFKKAAIYEVHFQSLLLSYVHVSAIVFVYTCDHVYV